MRRNSVVSARSDLWYEARKVWYQEGRCCITRRRLCSVRRNCTVSEWYMWSRKTGLWYKDEVCSIRSVTSAVQVEKVCSTRQVASAVRGELCRMQGESLQYQKVIPAVGRQGVWCEKKVCSIRNVTSTVQRESVQYLVCHICSTRRRFWSVRRECIG